MFSKEVMVNMRDATQDPRGTRLAVEKMRGAREEPRTQDPEGLDLFCFLRGATWWKVRGGLKVQWRGSVRQGDLSSQGEPVQEP